MNRKSAFAAGIAVALASACGGSSAQAQAAKYSKPAPVREYLMDRAAEVQLARSAAPPSISADATVMVLGPHGYETAAQGKNGFVCMVERSWMAGFDWPEFWNPKIRGANCLNPEAARSMVPIAVLRSRLAMAGRSQDDMIAAIRDAFQKGQLPKLEPGAMSYMLSKSAYLTDQGGHNGPHLMIYTTGVAARDWGADATGSPVLSAPYWFSSPQSRPSGLPPILIILISLSNWSDGSLAHVHI